MRQAVAKGMRRDIRRALGPTAIQTLDNHASGIRTLQTELVALATDYTLTKQAGASLAARVQERAELDSAVHRAAQALIVKHDELLMRSLWGRLRWLLKGC